MLREAGYDVFDRDRDPTGATGVIVVNRCHGTGKNLQHAQHQNLLLDIPPNAEILQQVIGRTHRPGQPSPYVSVDYLGNEHNDKCLEKASELAEMILDMTGQPQKILYCEKKLAEEW